MQTQWNKPPEFHQKIVRFIIVATIIIIVLLISIIYKFNQATQAPIEATTETETISTEQSETETETKTETSTKEIPFIPIEELIEYLFLQPKYTYDTPSQEQKWVELEQTLTAIIGDYSGNWSIYIRDLSNDNIININDQPQESASLIKLFVMGAIIEQLDNGTLERTKRIDRLLRDMITVSDNGATNTLVEYLSPNQDHTEGMEIVNDFAIRHGYSNTKHVNGLNNRNLRTSSTETNQTSAKDCGELLQSIYNRTLISHLASREMEGLLLAQEVLYKIPNAIPDSGVVANKTGETDTVENDSAIIYSPNGDFVLCIMSENWKSKKNAISGIREITRSTYDYFN